MYSIGTIVCKIINEPPRKGVWQLIGAGRTPVGVKEGNTLFNTPLKTGGAADKIIPYHDHTIAGISGAVHNKSGTLQGGHSRNSGGTPNASTGAETTGPTYTNYEGTSGNITNANYQPSYTCYFFVRVE